MAILPRTVASTASAVSTKHPDYLEFQNDWMKVRHSIRGDQAVKSAGEAYLPMPSGFKAQPDKGAAMYSAYSTRAQFPELVSPTVEGLVGVIHRTEIQVELPSSMEYLWERATPEGLTLEALSQRITRELLTTGRYSLLADAPSEGGEPYLVGYTAESLINWADDGTFFVLDETDRVREGFVWRVRPKFRVLEIQNNEYINEVYTSKGEQIGDSLNYERSSQIQPRRSGGAAFGSEIPFVVIGATEVTTRIQPPPVLGVTQRALAAYRLDADYRHQLFMTGQETLVFIGLDAQDLPAYVGAGVAICIPPDGDAKYVGPAGVGIEAHRQAIQDEYDLAAQHGARLMDTDQSSGESGEAKRIRYAAQTATLGTVARASAQGLERALRFVARFKGLPENKVVVKPNLNFLDSVLSPAEALNLVKVWQSGAISKRTLYEGLQRGEIASSERTFEEEETEIESEEPALGGPGEVDPITGLPIQNPPANNDDPEDA